MEIVKKNNCFLVKEFGRGSASKTVTIQPGKDQVVVLATTKTKKQNKPIALLHKSVMKHEIHRMAKVIANRVGDNYYQPDLKNAVEWCASKP
ncbi:60S ribosomal protein L28-2 [Citrus sinensis]|uniref:60S ribosomal protein L28-2 n=1 Tax=Citrus sinensis TaxID=2711 RepID=A0ACB8J6X1_CITSI|nr:60S ribosomal protein L28-2 [Citrus sinensis]